MPNQSHAAMPLDCPQSGCPLTAPATRNYADDLFPTGFGGGDEPGVSVPPVLIVASLRAGCR